MNERPTGVTILAILAFIRGVVLILFGGLAGLLGGVFATFSPALAGIGVVWGLVMLVLGAAFIYVGWGFWRLVAATWRFAIFLAAADILVAILVALFGGGGIDASTIVGVAIDLGIIYYLLTPGVKAAFGITGDLTTAITGGMMGGAAAATPPAPPPAEPPAAMPPPAAPPPPAASPPTTSSWSEPTAPSGSDMGAGSGGTESGSGSGGGGEDENA